MTAKSNLVHSAGRWGGMKEHTVLVIFIMTHKMSRTSSSKIHANMF